MSEFFKFIHSMNWFSSGALPGGNVEEFFIFIIAIFCACFIAFILCAAAGFFGSKNVTSFSGLNAQYECGFEGYESAAAPRLCAFYRFAVLFVLFEAEVVFLIPWVLGISERINDPGYFCLGFPFLAVLGVGFALEFIRGALEF